MQLEIISEWLRAKFFLLAVALVWGSMILFMLPLQAFVMVITLLVGSKEWKDWNYSIWMIQDQAVNVLLSGQHLTTISSSLGELSKTSSTANKMRRVVDFLFKVFAGQDNHCRQAIEPEDVHRYNAMKATIGVVGYVVSIACAFEIIRLIGGF